MKLKLSPCCKIFLTLTIFVSVFFIASGIYDAVSRLSYLQKIPFNEAFQYTFAILWVFVLATATSLAVIFKAIWSSDISDSTRERATQETIDEAIRMLDNNYTDDLMTNKQP